MPNNDLINIANVLSEKLNSNAPTSLADMVVDNGTKKQLNYEIMFQLLMGECEKHILKTWAMQLLMSSRIAYLKSSAHLCRPYTLTNN